MNKLMIGCLIGIAAAAALSGCGDPANMAQIDVVSVNVHDWTSPKDGKTYIVAAPTWKNSGPGIARSVYMTASLKKPDGKEEVLFDGSTKPIYYGSDVEPGTTVKPVKEPEDVLVLGEKDELTKKYGSISGDNVTVSAMGSGEKFEATKDSGA